MTPDAAAERSDFEADEGRLRTPQEPTLESRRSMHTYYDPITYEVYLQVGDVIDAEKLARLTKCGHLDAELKAQHIA